MSGANLATERTDSAVFVFRGRLQRASMTLVSLLTFVDHELVHLDKGALCWVDIKRFVIGDVNADDRSLLEALIADRQYRDHYAGQDPVDQDQDNLHGPYWLRAITPEMFELSRRDLSRRDEAERTIQSWADEPEPQSAETQTGLRHAVYPLLTGAIYRLLNLRDQAEHEWGWVVGTRGFHEFVAVDRDQQTLVLLVASDD